MSLDPLPLSAEALDHLLAEATSEGVLVHEQGRVLRANGALARLLRYERDELIGMHGADLVAETSRAAFLAHIARAPASPLEGTALRRDGTTFPCQVTGRTIAVGERFVRAVLVRDLTEQRAMEAALGRRDRELALITQHTPDLITRLDADHRVLFMSAAVEPATGRAPEWYVGRRLHELGFPTDRVDQWARAITEVLTTGEPRELRFSLAAPDGHARQYHARVVLERDEHVAAPTVLAVTRDLTALYAAEESLRAAEERFRGLVEHAGDLLAILDVDGVNRYASPSHLHVLGISPDALTGRHCFELVHPDDVASLRALFTDAVRLGEGARSAADARAPTRPIGTSTVPRDIRFATAAGTWRTVAVKLTDLRHVRAVNGIVANSRDVTDERALQERLRNAERMEAIGQLAGGVAHDFNNILAAIAGFAQLLRADLAPDSTQRAEVDEIVAAASRGADIVRQLLAFSRTTRLTTEVLDVAAVARDVGRMLKALLPPTIDLVVPAVEVQAWVRASRTALEQIIVNLAVNGRDAMPAGGTLRVDVHQRAGVDGSARVVLEVRDTGDGIPDEVRARMFEPFFTTKAAGQGTGLGLSTVYGLVRQLGGTLDVQTALGQGASFAITLPGAERPAAASPTARAVSHRLRGRALLVDDDDAVRRVSELALQRLGMSVVTATNGAEALRQLQVAGDFDLLLTDGAMPIMGGLELAAHARRYAPGLPIVLMSGYVHEVPGGARDGTVDAYLPKPFLIEDLQRVLGALLDRP